MFDVFVTLGVIFVTGLMTAAVMFVVDLAGRNLPR